MPMPPIDRPLFFMEGETAMTAYFSRLRSFLPKFVIEHLTEVHNDTFLSLFMNNIPYWEMTQGRPATARDFMDTVCCCPKNFAKEKAYCTGILEASTPVAILSILEDYPREGILYIGLFLVDNALQRKRVGSEVMAGVANACGGMFDAIQLSVQSNNLDALRFGESQGFFAEERAAERETDNLPMRKSLTRPSRMPENVDCQPQIGQKK
jgi:ribosomal protein S18 acetylase RimI-like enzyme